MRQEGCVLLVAPASPGRARIAAALDATGCAVSLAGTLDQARMRLTAGPVAMIMMGLSTATVADLAFAHEATAAAALIALVDRPETLDRLLAAGLCCDDHVLAPFPAAEVQARVKAALSRRRAKAGAPQLDVLTFSGWRLNLTAKALSDPTGRHVPLRPAEFKLLCALARRPGHVLSRDQLLDAVADRHASPFDRTIDALVGRLRGKIEEDRKSPRIIVTVTGFGYKLISETERLGAPELHLATVQPPVRSFEPAVIALLPFTPGGVASGGHAVAGALMEDLQFYLTRGSGCRVVVGGLATVHAAQELGLRQVGRDMAARYIISGAVHSFRNSLRITAHLTDAADGAQLWSERTTIERDSQTEALEAAIQRTTWSLMRQLYAAEGIRAELEGESDPTALLARGRAVGLRSYSRETIRTTRRYYEHALASDPGSVEAMAALGEQLVLGIVDRWSDDEAADTIRAEGLLRRALSAAPYSYTAYAGLGTLLRWQGQSDQAVAVLRRGLDIYPSPYAFRKLGLSLLYDGNAGEALSCIQRAAEMSDIEANRVNSTWALGACHQTLGEADEATTYLLKARASDPNLPCVRVRLAACFAQIGDLEEARRELCAAQAHKHHKTLAEIAEMPQVRQYNYRGRCEETFYAGLRLAGIVER